MHKLIEYVCDELEELERKADKGGKLTAAEIQYADMLAHLKKNLLKSDMMMEDEEGYSNESGNSYARGGRGRGRNARRDSMGRYSSDSGSYRQGGGSYEGSYHGGRGGSYDGYSREGAKEDMLMQLREMEQDADEESKRMIKRWIKQVEEQ